MTRPWQQRKMGHFDTDTPRISPAAALLAANVPHDGGPAASLPYVTQRYLT